MASQTHFLTVSNRTQEIPEGITLLEALAQMDCYLPAACDGRGSCGSCRCQITKPLVAYNFKEMPYLSLDERRSGIHLACQCIVKSDMTIFLPPDSLQARRRESRIISIEPLGNTAVFLNLELTNSTQEFFVPGQYALLEISDPQKEKLIQRAYSFASDPKDFQKVRFLITLAPGGAMTDYLQNNAHPGDYVSLIGPFGTFRSFEDNRPEIWVAAGSGIAPFLSMVQGISKQVILLLAKKNKIAIPSLEGSSCKVIPFSIDPKSTVPFFDSAPSIPAFLDDYLNRTSDLPDNMGFLLCTSPGIVDACINILKSHGVSHDRIRIDQFF